jgi:methionine synthase / methylenetetrahydrofolate reductase (NADH)
MTRPIKPFSEIFGSELLIFDGAMGTELYRHHIFTNRCYEELCLSNPKLIRRIHADYIQAGAQVLIANTYGANRVNLAKHGLVEKLAEINNAGVALARQVADESSEPVYVAGDIGPMPKSVEDLEEAASLILEQVDCLVGPDLNVGADFILFETVGSRAAIELLTRAMAQRPDVPFVVSFSMLCKESGQGESIDLILSPGGDRLAQMLASLPDGCRMPLGFGVNCGMGPSEMLPVVEAAVGLTELPLLFMPNAGMPKEVDGRQIYLSSPEYVSTYVQRYVRLGAAAVGGCCGIGPSHISEIVAMVKSVRKGTDRGPVTLESQPAEEPLESVPLAQRSEFGRRLAEGEWITSVELLPPRGFDLTDLIAKSQTLAEHGIAAVNIPDGPRASCRISPLVACAKIRQETDIEPVLHFCCRDRSLIGMQSDLLACAAADIHNILFITGDPPKLGDYPHSSGVFDTDSIGLTALQDRLNHGIELSGASIGAVTEAVIGVGLDPTALDRKQELKRFRQKVDAGAEYAITQPVFDSDALLEMLDQVAEMGEKYRIPIIAGVWPLASFRNATFMNNEVPGVVIPEPLMRRMESQESREGQLATGIEIARESVEQVRDRMAGIQVSAPFGRIEIALAVIEG